MTSAQITLSKEIINVKVYMPHDGQNFRELMADRIGPSKEGCFYIGEMNRMGRTMDLYHCFSTTVLADNESGSFIGDIEAILNSGERLGEVLGVRLVPIPPR